MRSVVEQFHELYYDSNVWRNTSWLGVETHKCPLDLWVYQEIICESRPDIIVESGTAYGGSALFLASVCDLLGHGEVVTIDIEDRAGRPAHKRIEYLHGSSVSEEIVCRVGQLVEGKRRVLVILDSDHSKEHVLRELEIYGEMVSPHSYLIVEDTNVNGHPVEQLHGPGPLEAVEEFLRNNQGFIMDREREKFFLTFNPRGFLQKIKQ